MKNEALALLRRPEPEYVIVAFNDLFGFGYFMGSWDKGGKAHFSSAYTDARRYKKLRNAEKALDRMKAAVEQHYGISFAASIVPAEMAEAYETARTKKWKESTNE